MARQEIRSILHFKKGLKTNLAAELKPETYDNLIKTKSALGNVTYSEKYKNK